jgi:hypothetical protein
MRRFFGFWVPMQSVSVQGISTRPILLCYRMTPGTAQGRLPKGARLATVNGFVVGGILGLPSFSHRALGIASRWTCSYRIVHFLKVTRHQAGTDRDGIFIIRRDTSSRLHAFIGQCRPVPPHHAHVQFGQPDEGAVDLRVSSDDAVMQVCLKGHLAPSQPTNSIFSSPAQALESLESAVFLLGRNRRNRSSASNGSQRRWRLQPLAVEETFSSIFHEMDNGSTGVEFDSAYSIQEVEYVWSKEPATRATKSPRTSLTFLQS